MRVCYHPGRKYRRDAAAERAVEAEKRNPTEQLARLDARLGTGQGAKKERDRLQKLLTASKPVEAPTSESNTEEKPKRKRTKKSKG